MAIKQVTTFVNFDSLDIRAGKIIDVDNAQTKKPTYRITIDLGPEIGRKVSCGAYRSYAKDYLLGKTVVCIVNLGPKKMGPETSEVLILGIANAQGETIFLTTDSDVPMGSPAF